MAFKMVALLRKAGEGGDGTSQNSDKQIEFLKNLAGVEHVTVGKITGSPQGEVDFDRSIEMYFKDEASARAAVGSSGNRSEAAKLFKGKPKLFFVNEQ